MSKCKNCIRLEDQILQMRIKIAKLVQHLDLHEIVWALEQL